MYTNKRYIIFLFPALIRENSAESKAHDPHIILKIELQHLKEWTGWLALTPFKPFFHFYTPWEH